MVVYSDKSILLPLSRDERKVVARRFVEEWDAAHNRLGEWNGLLADIKAAHDRAENLDRHDPILEALNQATEDAECSARRAEGYMLAIDRLARALTEHMIMDLRRVAEEGY